MRLDTQVNFPGNCAEALRHEKHLGAKAGMMMTDAQAPDQSRISPEWGGAVVHRAFPLAIMN
jgi:uncharacterized glyoxalase superfamily protein PhnB